MKKFMMIAVAGIAMAACDEAAMGGGDGRTLLQIVEEDRPWESGYDGAYNRSTDCDASSDPGFYSAMAKTTSLNQVRRYYGNKGWKTDDAGHEDVDFMAIKTIFSGGKILRSGNANRTFYFPRCLMDYS